LGRGTQPGSGFLRFGSRLVAASQRRLKDLVGDPLGGLEDWPIVPPPCRGRRIQRECCRAVAGRAGADFDIITRESIEASRSGNPFAEKHQIICRLDQLSRSEEIQAKLELTDWDLVVVDEAHKMSAHFYGNEVQKTKRYQLGERLAGLTRHLLLMTATPHSGKPEDFQLFMALVDADQFEGSRATARGRLTRRG
jgi:hypothetical protein